MGRTLRRTARRAGRRTAGKRAAPATRDCPLMDRAALEAMWNDGWCGHATTVMSLHRLCVTLECSDCGLRAVFLLRFGRPRMFEVFMHGGAWWPVGRASTPDAGRFILAATSNAITPDWEAEPEGESETLDQNLTAMLMGVLSSAAGGVEPAPTLDFAGPWRGMDCRHGQTMCYAYSDYISLRCMDCAALLWFKIYGTDAFDVSMARTPLPPVEYGLHGAGAVIDILREFARTLNLPDKMADRMSADPDHDARSIASLVAALERGGLLRRLKIDPTDTHNAMSRAMSAALHTRSEFAASAKAAATRLGDASFREDDMAVDTQRRLEALWLSWPFRFDGAGINIYYYDPDGRGQYCIRCGLSTVYDTSVGQDHWRHGCPECGYAGYLLDMDGGSQGRRVAWKLLPGSP